MDVGPEEEATPEAALTRLTLLVFRLNGLILATGDRLAAPAGQTSARWQVMGVVDHEPLTVAEVARRMGLRRQSVQRTADRLVAAGAAAHLDNPSDRRARLLTLTPAGRRSLRVVEAAQGAWARDLGNAVGLQPLLAAEATLARIVELLEAG
jgi:DNA-binding MarR family transcriptional regulator